MVNFISSRGYLYIGDITLASTQLFSIEKSPCKPPSTLDGQIAYPRPSLFPKISRTPPAMVLDGPCDFFVPILDDVEGLSRH